MNEATIQQTSQAPFKIAHNGLEITDEPTFKEWREYGQTISKYNDSLHFTIGDWLNYGQLKWGETYKEALRELHFDIQTLRNDKWVAYKVAKERRFKGLSFTHFKEVAKFDAEDQEKYLQEAFTKKLTIAEFRQYIKKGEGIMEAPKKVSPRRDSKDQLESSASLAETKTSADSFLTQLDTMNLATLSEKGKKELFKTLSEIEKRCVGIEMEYGDDE